MNQAGNVHKLGRFTVSTVNNDINNYLTKEAMYSFLNILVKALSQSQSPNEQEIILSNLINENQILYSKLIEHDLELITFSSYAEPYISLFNNIDKLKHSLIIDYINNSKNDIKNISWFRTLPLSIQFTYIKYISSLLVFQPIFSCSISLEELKTFINQRLIIHYNHR